MKKIKRTKKSKLSVIIPMQIIGIISIIMLTICIVLSAILFNLMSVRVDSEVSYINQANANKAQSYLDKMNTIAKSLSSEVSRYNDLEQGIAEEMLKNSLNQVLEDDSIFSAYFAFEPNKYFENTPDGLSYYAFRDGTSIKMDILNDYATYSTGDYYATPKKIMSTHITQPYSYQLTTGETVWLITLSNPVLDKSGNFIGIASCDILSSSISDLQYDLGGYNTAYSYIITDGGTYIAHSSDKDIIGTAHEGIVEGDNSILGKLFSEVDVVLEGTNSVHGGKASVIHTPIHVDGTDSTWLSGYVVSEKEKSSSVYFVIIVVAIIAIIGLVILAAFSYLILKKSLKPIQGVMKLAENMKNGNLNSDEEIEIKTNDELGELTQIFRDTSESLNSYISDIAYVLNNLSSGNLKIDIEKEYIGDFKSISVSLKKIIESLNAMFNKIRMSADEVSASSEQVAMASQQLSQGATEQASSVEEFAATIQEISSAVKNSAKNANDANEKAKRLGFELDNGNHQMEQMIAAMEIINNKSSEIGKIIKAIEDIAFQTNILALNAAVEAARAGSAGKGFAVVADEVRNLASKSAEAAKDTTSLIEDTIKAVHNGTVIANNTEKTLLGVIEETNNIINIINNISKETQEQSSAIEQVTVGIEQISAVIQTNSATAEESAASSEELSGQSDMMKELLGVLQLKNL